MNISASKKWTLFRALCRVLGDQDRHILQEIVAAGQFPSLVELAQQQEVLPAMAVRCGEYIPKHQILSSGEGELLKKALRDNTVRNMQISAQALKMAALLNKAGIAPLFLKGTVQLLDPKTTNLGFRKQVDIDLLVKPEQLETASNLLLADGYEFYDFANSAHSGPILLPDPAEAIRGSAAHHHLPPLLKKTYATTVELHRHFLPKRFQRKIPLEPMFSTAISMKRNEVRFLFPSTEYQIVHLILGKFVHDGHITRRTFPLREACDYISLMENNKGHIDYTLVAKHCQNEHDLFSQLLAELMDYPPETNRTASRALDKRIQTMQRRYDYRTLGKLWDSYARALHLSHSLAHSPAKLPAYLSRLRSG